MMKYVSKEDEYNTPPKARIYCSHAGCGRFLGPDRFEENNVAICMHCNRTTCGACRSTVESNVRHRCGGVEEDKTIEEFASNEGLKHCPRCNMLIELTEACNHIDCSNCGHSFCFVCLLPFRPFDDDSHNCPEYHQPEYDEDGRDWRGLHRDTGLDADGYNQQGCNDKGLNRAGELQPIPLDEGWADDNEEQDDDNTLAEFEFEELNLNADENPRSSNHAPDSCY